MAQSYAQVFIGAKKKDIILKIIQRKQYIKSSSCPLIILQKYPLIMIQKQKNLVQITISSQTLRCAFRYATTGPQNKLWSFDNSMLLRNYKGPHYYNEKKKVMLQKKFWTVHKCNH